MLIPQRRKRSLQDTKSLRLLQESCPVHFSLLGPLPCQGYTHSLFASRADPFCLSPSSLCNFLWWDDFPFCCVLEGSSSDPCPLHAPPPTLCSLWDRGSRGGLFAVHTSVSTSEGWSKCSGDICRVDKRQSSHCGFLSLLDWALLAFLIFQSFFRVVL